MVIYVSILSAIRDDLPDPVTIAGLREDSFWHLLWCIHAPSFVVNPDASNLVTTCLHPALESIKNIIGCYKFTLPRIGNEPERSVSTSDVDKWRDIFEGCCRWCVPTIEKGDLLSYANSITFLRMWKLPFDSWQNESKKQLSEVPEAFPIPEQPYNPCPPDAHEPCPRVDLTTSFSLDDLRAVENGVTDSNRDEITKSKRKEASRGEVAASTQAIQDHAFILDHSYYCLAH